jgi:Tol biopolymer transport system component
LRLENPCEGPVNIVDTRCHFTKMVVSEDGRWLAAYGKPNSQTSHQQRNTREVNDVFLWDLSQLTRNGHLGSPIVLKGHEKPIRSLAISNNSRWLVSGSEDRTVRVYDLKASYPAAEQIVLKGHELAVNCVAISPDGRWLVTGGRDSILRIWDMQSRQSMAVPMELQEHEGWISALVFSPDGQWLASGSYDNTIRLWRMTDASRPEVTHVLTGHVSRIMAMEFFRKSNQLVSLGFDREVRLWNLGQGNPSENPLVFRSNQFPVSSAMLTGDGKWLILAQQKTSAPGNSGVRLWPLVFEQTFDFAANFAETRFPTMYQRQQNAVSPIPEQQEERIAMTGNFAQNETQFPFISDTVSSQQYGPSPDNIPLGMSPVPSLPQPPQALLPPFPFPPSDGQVRMTTPGTSFTLPQERYERQ